MKLKLKSGNTPLVRSEILSKKFNIENILIKDESKNPFGTFKDRISKFVIKQAKNDYVDKIALITSGNAGYSFAKFAEGTKIKVVCIIDKSLRKKIKDKLSSVSYKVITIDLSKRIIKPEEVIALARENKEEVIWEVTNGYHKVYESIVREIKGENPDYILIPIGSGEGFVGIYEGIKKYKLKTKLIGIGIEQKWSSLADKLQTPYTPYKAKIAAICRESHKYIRLDEEEVKNTFETFKKVVNCEPSSAVVFAAFSKVKFNNKDKIVVINTGRGIT